MCISFVGFVFFSIGLGMLLSKLEDGSRVIIQLNQAMYVMVINSYTTSNGLYFGDALVLKIVKPQSHRIVRFLYRTIVCDWAKVRASGNVCYDRSLRVVALS